MENNQVYNNLIQIIRSELFDDSFSIENLSQIDLKSVFKLSVMHDISSIVSFWGKKQKCIPDKTKMLFNNDSILSVYRHEKMTLYLTELSKLFENNNIEYIPLKGAIIKNLYNTPHFRTSCDIDILIKEENLEKAISLIKDTFEILSIKKIAHDVSIYLEKDIHLELHFSLLELHKTHDRVVENPWKHIKESQTLKKEFTNEFFVAYFITHMAHHFLQGGCGIKPFIDLYIINKKMPYDKEKMYNILKVGNLTKFADVMFDIAEIWFGNGKHNDLTLQIEEFIFSGGVYGSKEQSVELNNASGGKGKFILKRIFMPYKNLCVGFPILKKVPILYPFCLVIRWFQALFSKRIKNASKEIKIMKSVNNEKMKKSKNMLDALEL